jgi:formiminotetrahydrofolate cyclodeaminase
MSLLNRSVAEFLVSLSRPEPVPGGGSAAALAGAVGCAIAVLDAEASAMRPEDGPLVTSLIEELNGSMNRFASLVENDAEALHDFLQTASSRAVTAAERAKRGASISMKLNNVVKTPLLICDLAVGSMSTLDKLSQKARPKMLSDFAVSAALLRASFDGARAVAELNLTMLHGDARVPEVRAQLDKAAGKVHATHSRIQSRLLKTLHAPEEEPCPPVKA